MSKLPNMPNSDFCSEAYVIEKTIEVVVNFHGEDVAVRIDALRAEPSGTYSTRAFIEAHVKVAPSFPKPNGPSNEDVLVWKDHSLPWTSRSTADEALNQALGFLKDQCQS